MAEYNSEGHRFTTSPPPKVERKRKCCSHGKYSDTGKYSKGQHTHARDHSAKGRVDEGTGHKFIRDQSTTKAVLKRMRALGKD